jgi:hypothetical protein
MRRRSAVIQRRDFLKAAGTIALAGCTGELPAASSRSKPPYRVLYSNDTTNIASCTSPYHQPREPFRPQMLEASIDEVAGHGVDVHLLQPGLGWVPWWPSKVYPAREHYDWLKQTYGLNPDSFGKWVLGGGDLVQVFVDRCRKRGQAPFISYRLNDAHAKENADLKPGDKFIGGAAQALTKFYCEHPDYRIGPDLKSGTQHVQNWAIPAVREHKFAFIRELCENYDLDGLELDFLRFASYFQLDKTNRSERAEIMTRFVGDVRKLLDRTERGGRHRWLCVRVPCYLSAHDPLGIDLPAMVAAGVEMVNVSASYFTQQVTDFARIRASVPEAAVYRELCHSIWNGAKLLDGYDTFPFRRTTREEYDTTAHLAYAEGADGMSLFNFVYYRPHGAGDRGQFAEPPFDVLDHLGDRAWLARQPQHYFLATGWRRPFSKQHVVPRDVAVGKPATFTFDVAPPAGGWRQGGRLRIQAESDLGDSRWSARLGERELQPTSNVAEPYANPYPTMLGKPEEMRAWQVPADALAAGSLRVEVTCNSGEPARIDFLDLAVS